MSDGSASMAATPEGRTLAGAARALGAASPPGPGPYRSSIAVHAVGMETVDLPENATPAYVGLVLFTDGISRAVIQGVYER